jgi:hypothetical protein
MTPTTCRLFGAFALLATLMAALGGQDSGKFLAQGNAFRSQGKSTEALWAYRQSAKSGNVNGAYAAGEVLLVKGLADEGQQRVLELSEGIGYLFFAATNRHAQACAELANVLQNGIGVQTNLVCSYAWLKLAAEFDRSFDAKLDRLVVQLEPEDVLQAQKIARQYLSGHWPDAVARPIARGDSRLAIQGLSVSGREPLIILNGGTLTVGEMINVSPVKSPGHAAGEKLVVSCCEIGADYALVSVAGEPSLKMLPIESH